MLKIEGEYFLFVEMYRLGEVLDMERKCTSCGALHWLKSHHIPMKDTDTEECKKCGEVLISWRKSTTIYSAELREAK